MTKPCALIAVALTSLLLHLPAARAQSDQPCTPGVRGYLNLGITRRTGIPYTATVKHSFEQKLSDGNTIRGSVLTHVARDAAGRTMQEAVLNCEVHDDGQIHALSQFIVVDPAAKTNTSWMTGDGNSRVATVTHFLEPHRPVTTPPRPDPIDKSRSVRPSASEYRVERLDGQSVAGVPCTGIRRTRTIPAGEAGNDQPLQIIEESLSSSEFGLTLRSVMDDPRLGRRIAEVVEISRNEPDPSLFTPPPRYTIIDHKPNVEVVEPATQ